MGRPCSICHGPRRISVNRLLSNGTPDAEVARRFGIDRGTVRRHRQHVQSQIDAALTRREADAGEQHLEKVLSRVQDGDRWLEEALEALKLETSDGQKTLSPDGALAIPRFVKELRQNQELRAKLLGLLKDAGGEGSSPQIMIVVPPSAPLGSPTDLSIPGIQDAHGRLLPNRGQLAPAPGHHDYSIHGIDETGSGGDSSGAVWEDPDYIDAEITSPSGE